MDLNDWAKRSRSRRFAEHVESIAQAVAERVVGLAVELLDVNALIALVDADHVKHDAMHRWFAAHVHEGWATCSITENGMVRVLSQPIYPSGQRTPAEVIDILARHPSTAHFISTKLVRKFVTQ